MPTISIGGREFMLAKPTLGFRKHHWGPWLNERAALLKAAEPDVVALTDLSARGILLHLVHLARADVDLAWVEDNATDETLAEVLTAVYGKADDKGEAASR